MKNKILKQKLDKKDYVYLKKLATKEIKEWTKFLLLLEKHYEKTNK